MPQRAIAGVPAPWVAAAAIAAAAVAVWVTLRADFLAHPGWLAAQKADIILGPVLVGLYWMRRRPESRFGPLLVTMGFVAGVPFLFQSSSEPVLYGIGLLWDGVIYLFTLVLIVSFPTGRLDGRAERAIVAAGAVSVPALLTVVVLLAPQLGGGSSIAECRTACPENGLNVLSEPALALDLLRVGEAGLVLVALATIALIVWRLVMCTPPRRRALAIGAPVALAFLVSQAAYQSANVLEVQAGDVYPIIQWTIVGTRSSIWYGFLLALIAAELFAGRMLRRVVIESLRRPAPSELEATLRGPLADPIMRLAFRERAGDVWVDARGDPLESPDPASGRVLTEVQRDGRVAAAIVHDAQLAEEPELLQAAGAIVLLVQENAELEAAWKTSLADLRDSRSRIVAASELERRKLERDLHDGAQQRLVSLRIRLAIASEQAAADPVAHSTLAELEGELDESIEELRDLAHGIFPSLLADRGLLPALRAVGRRGPRPIEVTGRRIGRYPPEIESAVYYCCLEALQNATKHAGPEARIAAKLSADEEELRVEVRDDGPGFDVTTVNGGVGLRNMEDRLGAVRGRLVITTSPGHGTLIAGVIPIR
jgi:signal transduction histidine kinase